MLWNYLTIKLNYNIVIFLIKGEIMKKILLAGLLLLSFAVSATAREGVKGGYVGLAYGSTTYSVEDNLNLEKDENSGYKLYLGYQFNRIIGIEGSYANYGKFVYANAQNIKTTGVGIAANIGYNFLEDQLRPFALLGLDFLRFNQGGTSWFKDNSVTAFKYGLGLEYSPKTFAGVGFRVLWETSVFNVKHIGKDDNEPYGFSMFSISVQYKF